MSEMTGNFEQEVQLDQETGTKETKSELQKAGALRRYFARMFDLFIIGIPVYIVFAIIGYILLGDNFLEWVTRPQSSFFMQIAILPPILAAETFLYDLFGNTPGKSLFKINVVTAQGDKPIRSQYGSRLIGVYSQGLLLGIPYLSFFSMLYQLYALKKRGTTSYDSDKFVVVGEKLTGRRIGLIALVYIAILILFWLSLFGILMIFA